MKPQYWVLLYYGQCRRKPPDTEKVTRKSDNDGGIILLCHVSYLKNGHSINVIAVWNENGGTLITSSATECFSS